MCHGFDHRNAENKSFIISDVFRATRTALLREIEKRDVVCANCHREHTQTLDAVRYRRNRDTGQEGITVAGLLMFGKPEALREWRSRHLVGYRLVSGMRMMNVAGKIVFLGKVICSERSRLCSHVLSPINRCLSNS